MTQSVQFNADLIRRYDQRGPRYTSYPTAVQFHEGFDHVAYERFVAASNAVRSSSPARRAQGAYDGGGQLQMNSTWLAMSSGESSSQRSTSLRMTSPALRRR